MVFMFKILVFELKSRLDVVEESIIGLDDRFEVFFQKVVQIG